MKKKMIAPIVIGIIIASYFLLWIAMIILTDMNGIMTLLIAVPLIALLFLWIYVVKERIEEIRSGEEDDLSQY